MNTFSEFGHGRAELPSGAELESLPEDGGPEFNRLVFEQSPYLLQHARNPVDWYPWGEEAFAKARREDKPVFLSVGYATCHWCHVMERESFEDQEVGAFLSEHFVPVKVDREERPDIDEVYMTVTQAMTGSGGWPMTVVMTPDRKPFFAGTYFPKHDRPGRPGLLTVLRALGQVWKTDRARVLDQGEKVAEFLQQQVRHAAGELPGDNSFRDGYAYFAGSFDAVRGGFGSAPKFPMPQSLSFLLRYHRRNGEPKALEMVEKTLQAMRRGGLFDHIGWGTHRYSTDAEWLVPHFEKMLYDQALLAIANVEAWQATKNPGYARTASEILGYVSRDMTSPEGGFYSAEDADSEGVEGRFYLWTPDELRQILGAQDAALFAQVFEIRDGGNFRDEASGMPTGESIPHLRKSLSAWSEVLRVPEIELAAKVERSREALFRHRELRIHPLKDDKILTDWNGLMISAFAKAAQALDDPAYLGRATAAADFLLTRLRREDGRLLKRYRSGQAGLAAHLEDYAFAVAGMLDLYEAGFEPRFLRAAIDLTGVMVEHFLDRAGGGFFMTADDSEELLVRTKSLAGGAIPSGNAVAALNLARLHGMTGKDEHREHAERLIRAFGAEIEQYPGAYPVALAALDFLQGPSQEVVLAGGRDDSVLGEMLRVVRTAYLPNTVVVHRPPGDPAELAVLAPFAAAQGPVDGRTTGYVCESFQCRLPVHTAAELAGLLGIARPGEEQPAAAGAGRT